MCFKKENRKLWTFTIPKDKRATVNKYIIIVSRTTFCLPGIHSFHLYVVFTIFSEPKVTLWEVEVV